MNRSELEDAIKAIIDLQPVRMFILAGLFLTAEQIKLVQSELTPDDPPVGAQGRYWGNPVFLVEPGQPLPLQGEIVLTEMSHGIGFSFVQMDCEN